jgi:hypothetical protein
VDPQASTIDALTATSSPDYHTATPPAENTILFSSAVWAPYLFHCVIAPPRRGWSCRNGIAHVIFESLDFIARLAALVPKPRVNLTRFHGVFAPNSALRQQVTPARRGRQNNEPRTSAQRHAAMTWAQRLKRVFKIDIESCEQCGDARLIYRESRHSVRAYQHYLNTRCWPLAPVQENTASGGYGQFEDLGAAVQHSL